MNSRSDPKIFDKLFIKFYLILLDLFDKILINNYYRSKILKGQVLSSNFYITPSGRFDPVPR